MSPTLNKSTFNTGNDCHRFDFCQYFIRAVGPASGMTAA
jgi:hypothetical protein